MRILLDTNVLVSAFIFKRETISKMLDFLIDCHVIVLSSHILDELKSVVEAKFPSKLASLNLFLDRLPFELVYCPDSIDKNKFPPLRDNSDLPVLASAIMSDVDCLLTGDKDFASLKLERPLILTPAQFLEKYGDCGQEGRIKPA